MAEVGKEYSFDITKTDEIFDRLLKDEQLKLEDGHVLSSAEEVMGKKYCKWHNSWSHTTNNCVVFRNHLQKEILVNRAAALLTRVPGKEQGPYEGG